MWDVSSPFSPCPTQALPLTRFQAVVALAVGRLADKSVLVCKNAIQLLASFLANNPFSCKVSKLDLPKREGIKWKQVSNSVTSGPETHLTFVA